MLVNRKRIFFPAFRIFKVRVWSKLLQNRTRLTLCDIYIYSNQFFQFCKKHFPLYEIFHLSKTWFVILTFLPPWACAKVGLEFRMCFFNVLSLYDHSTWQFLWQKLVQFQVLSLGIQNQLRINALRSGFLMFLDYLILLIFVKSNGLFAMDKSYL